MPYQRYEPFTDEELHEIRFGLMRAERESDRALRAPSAQVCRKLQDEIGHVQEQREMRRRREELPA